MLYQIENLKCGYNGSGDVLHIPSLNIEPGQTIVVLGKSGYGKSTFLETLALMNNTITDGKILFQPPSANGARSIELSEIWQKPNHNELAAVRCKYFSFIFQQTNLMPNFSVYENIYITRMMQGYSPNDCHQAAKDILKSIGMSGIDSNRKVTELSGGQRQRVAFARAIVSSFDVLFGDEPTGNLDEINSIELLQLLNDFIKNSHSTFPKTAIIVSHSIDLAVSYADTIMVITRNQKDQSGEIIQENIFKKAHANHITTWDNNRIQLSGADFKSHLRDLFSKN